MYTHDRCKSFLHFFPRFPEKFAQFGNRLQAPKRQPANLQIFNVGHIPCQSIDESSQFTSFHLYNYTNCTMKNTHWCENSTSAKPSDNVELMTLINLYKAKWRRRRMWVRVCSNEWIKGTLRGLYLQDTEFEKTFRMSRNSFEQLHALLGFQFNSW